MKYLADLHVHSHYSRATSKASHLQGLAVWAAVKGIQVVATGDFTHPGWFAHLHRELEPAEPGFFRLKPNPGYDFQALLPLGLRPAFSPEDIRFILSAEVSSIYKRGGKVRKVHNLLYAPDFESVQRVNATLATLGNIASDGRPILGLDSRDLLEILLEKAPEGFLVPAHIWTPWFSLFGSKSGFDSLEECFGDLSEHVFALETGLSSDPEMNRMISMLDRLTLISNSDCHSPSKLGREANIFTTGFDYFSLREALRSPASSDGTQVFAATIEFYPEEGKYHCDGHRKCGVCLEPSATRKADGLCPSCGKPLTIGVLHRVMELADRPQPVFPSGSPKVHSLIPLQEIVSELLDCGPTSNRAIEGYVRLINMFGSEFALLLDIPIDEIKAKAGALIAEAIARVRANRVVRQPGYDGEFGVIKVFSAGERAAFGGQTGLFGAMTRTTRKKTKREQLDRPRQEHKTTEGVGAQSLNSEQQRAVESEAIRVIVQAGPGTGKTHTLVRRVAWLMSRSASPCTVITFTNKAAAEVRERLLAAVGNKTGLTVTTFHGYCLMQLRRTTPALQVVGPEERDSILEELYPDWQATRRAELSRALADMSRQPSAEQPVMPEITNYLKMLEARSLIDLETVVPRTVDLLRQGGAAAESIRAATGHLLVDEFQDVNQEQFNLVALLAESSTIFAIGDPDQAIYGFRGSDPKWFQALIDQFHPEFHQLVRNYRSGRAILQAAEQLINHNPHLGPLVRMQPVGSLPGALHLHVCGNPGEEAAYIADQIELQLGGTSHRSLDQFDATGIAQVTFRDIGILFRTSRQAEAISSVLAARGIPFQLVDLEAYYTNGPCRLLYCWALALAGLANLRQWLFLLEQEKGIGQQSLKILQAALRASCLEAARPEQLFGGVVLSGAADVSLARFRQLHVRMCALSKEQSVVTTLHLLMDYYGIDAQQPEMARFCELALTFGNSISAFAQHLQTFSDSVVYDERAEAVTLSTLHAAKGLEFPVVFIVGLEDGLLPLAPRSRLEASVLQAHLEEERRLMYVGMTRAIATLYLSWCRQRTTYESPDSIRTPSRFLAEVPNALFSDAPISRTIGKKGKKPHRQLSLFS